MPWKEKKITETREEEKPIGEEERYGHKNGVLRRENYTSEGKSITN